MAFKTADKNGSCPMCGQMMPAQTEAEPKAEMKAEGESPASKLYPGMSKAEFSEVARKQYQESRAGKSGPPPRKA